MHGVPRELMQLLVSNYVHFNQRSNAADRWKSGMNIYSSSELFERKPSTIVRRYWNSQRAGKLFVLTSGGGDLFLSCNIVASPANDVAVRMLSDLSSRTVTK